MMRLFACCLVVITHSVMPQNAENGTWVGLMSFVCSPSSEMFLMLSGAILLPVRTDMGTFYKRRFLKLLPPMFVWSLFGIALRYFQGKTTCLESFMKLLFLPLKPVEGVYWFLYVMIGLYLFAPIISHWLQQASKRQIEFALGIWLVNMFMPWMELLVPGFYNQDGSYYWPLCYFGGFIGYWLLGYYLRKYSPTLLSKYGLFAVGGSVVYTIIVFWLKITNNYAQTYTDNLQIGNVFVIVLFFIIIKWFSETPFANKFLNQIVANIAQYSFGIYLLHIYVVRDIVWVLMDSIRIYNHPILESLFVATISMTMCVIVIKTLSLIYSPLGKWLFGLK